MSASSASTITCSALLFSFSPTANCNGAPLTRSSYTTLAGSNGEQEKPSAKGAWEANEREGPGAEAVASVAGLKTRRGNRIQHSHAKLSWSGEGQRYNSFRSLESQAFDVGRGREFRQSLSPSPGSGHRDLSISEKHSAKF